MKETELKPCPFCGSHERPFISSFRDFDRLKWNLSHYCTRAAEGLSITIEIYGKSSEEVIERWNRRADDEQREAD